MGLRHGSGRYRRGALAMKAAQRGDRLVELKSEIAERKAELRLLIGEREKRRIDIRRKQQLKAILLLRRGVSRSDIAKDLGLTYQKVCQLIGQTENRVYYTIRALHCRCDLSHGKYCLCKCFFRVLVTKDPMLRLRCPCFHPIPKHKANGCQFCDCTWTPRQIRDKRMRRPLAIL
jgi:hypothetical protein